MKYLLFSIVTIIVLSGCSYTNDLLKVEDKDRKVQAFKGLLDVINEAGDTNILFIHGMNTYSSKNGLNDPCYVINDVRIALGKKPVDFSKEDNKNNCNNKFKFNNKSVHMKDIYWSGITGDRKSLLNTIDRDETFKDNRIWLTTEVKDFINKGFSDAIMYTGVFRQRIIDTVIDNYRNLNETDKNTKNIIVTFSLGSAIMLDSLEVLEKKNKELIAKNEQPLLKNKIDMVYMMANQVPLIRAGTTPLSEFESKQMKTDSEQTSFSNGKGLYDDLAPFLSKQKNNLTPEIRIVAFSDPNDLLSYPLDRGSMALFRDEYVNVITSIAEKTYYIPFTEKWRAVNYLKAHTGHVYDEEIKQLLLYGNH